MILIQLPETRWRVVNCSLKGVVNGCSVMSQRRDVAEDGFETLGVHCISLIIIL